jgi:hypothetical protein
MVGLLELGIASPHAWTQTMKEFLMAKLIEFYVPKTFRMARATQSQHGKVIEFCSRTKKSA